MFHNDFLSLSVTFGPTFGMCHKHVLCTPMALHGIVTLFYPAFKLGFFKNICSKLLKGVNAHFLTLFITSCHFLSLFDQHFIAPILIRERHPRLHHTSTASGDFLFIQWPPTYFPLEPSRALGEGPRPRSQGRFGIAGIRTRTGSDVCSVVANCATPARIIIIIIITSSTQTIIVCDFVSKYYAHPALR